MLELAISSHGRFEELGSYSRVRRVGPFVYVAGTTAVEPSGRLHCPDDTYRQTRYVLERIGAALTEAGSALDEVVRTRAYLVDLGTAAEFARAHGEVFGEARPACTAVGARLTVPGMSVEIEAEALVRAEL